MPTQPLDSGDAYIRHFVKTLKTAIETDHSFYPPILIAHGLHALVAQKYVESNPVSALVLVSPFIPDVIQRRFQELSHKLQLKDTTSKAATVNEDSKKDTSAAILETTQEDSVTKAEATVDTTATTPASSSPASSSSSSSATFTDLPDFAFETHADVLAQDGFRERFVLPKKAVYKIDQVAKEHQEKEEAELKKKKQEESVASTAAASEGESTKDSSMDAKTSAAAEETESSSTTPTKETTESAEVLGRDSVPIWESKEGKQDLTQESSSSDIQDEVPIQTVESEASIPSALEQLPLSIYKTIPPSLFEPTFPILLVTSDGDELVSTNDVKERHVLAGQVDHIELEDLNDGGHLIMVSDNAEWEQGIQGITAWLDSNGM
ncbi:hypothetical protein EC991_000129 [Linnemannia zychae]|nr:hypothetical protein EC991_000129 [Linnemannia zychae]